MGNAISSNRRIGYARVSDEEQNLDLQIVALEKAGCTKIYRDLGVSGSTFSRGGLSDCLEDLQSGDTLVIWKVDRLGRDAYSLMGFCLQLREKEIGFLSIQEGFDTATSYGWLTFQLLACFAEFERKMILERQKAGIAAAQKKGTHCGRKRLLNQELIDYAVKLRLEGKSVKDVCRVMSISIGTYYNRVNPLLELHCQKNSINKNTIRWMNND